MVYSSQVGSFVGRMVMRDGIETLFFVFFIFFGPLFVFDLTLNQGRMWQIVVEKTLIDETFHSLVRLIY